MRLVRSRNNSARKSGRRRYHRIIIRYVELFYQKRTSKKKRSIKLGDERDAIGNRCVKVDVGKKITLNLVVQKIKNGKDVTAVRYFAEFSKNPLTAAKGRAPIVDQRYAGGNAG
jgi:hypothetical protein